MSVTCIVCGKELAGKRADAKTCSTACRTSLSIERKKAREWVGPQPNLSEVRLLLEEKLSRIETQIQGCRLIIEGRSERYSCGAMLRSLFEIEEAARSVIPGQQLTTTAKEREEERYALLRKIGWC